jgi:hypothetical protein
LIGDIPDLPIADLIVRTSSHIETEIGDLASIDFISGLKPCGVGATDVVLKNEIGVRPRPSKGIFVQNDTSPVVSQVGAQITSTTPFALI